MEMEVEGRQRCGGGGVGKGVHDDGSDGEG